VQDPFETPYNVARTVTKDGLYTVSVFARFFADPITESYRASGTIDPRRIHACDKSKFANPARARYLMLISNCYVYLRS
jgi:hypothetical protein